MIDDSTSGGSTELDDILADYVVSEEAGRPVSRDDLLRRHPQFAQQLREFFADRDRFRRLARPLSPAASRHNDLPAKVRYFGDYELLEEIAQGGMGVVYKARQTSLNRIVAVKMILAGHLASDDDIQRFTDEAKTAARLKHPAIVPIHEVGQHSGQHYFSMDYIDGPNLAQWIRTQRPSPLEAAGLIKAIAEAVDYAHEQGIVHRDIKPSNILIGEAGQVHITDFGLALRVEGDSELTRTGQVMGTPSYMSPEQAKGKRALVGPASDIYSLGAILYEILTGRPPFRGETAVETIQQVIDTEPLPLRRLNPHAPRDLETICLRCLQKEPHARYGTAALLADDLGRFQAGEPVLARPVGRLQRAVRWCRREPVVAALTATIAVLLVVGTCVSSYFAAAANRRAVAEAEQRRLAQQRAADALDARDAESKARALAEERLKEAKEAQDRADREADRAEAEAGKARQAAESEAEARSLTRHSLYVARMNLVQQAWQSGDVDWMNQLLSREFTDSADDPRGFEWHYWWHVGHPKRKILEASTDVREPAELINCVTYSADGRLVVSVSAGGVIPSYGGPSSWSGDVRNHGTGRSIKVWHAESGGLRSIFEGHEEGVTAIALSPDSKTLASAATDGTIKLWDLVTVQQKAELAAHADSVIALGFSPDASQLTSVDRQGLLTRWNTKTYEPLDRQSPFVNASCGVLSLDTAQLVFGTPSGEVGVWSCEQGELVARLAEHGSSVTCVALSNDGSWLAAACTDRTVRIWDLIKTRLSLALRTDDQIVSAMAFSPDARWLVCGGDNGAVQIWDLERRFVVGQRKGHRRPITAAAFSPDASRLVTGSVDGTVLWEPPPELLREDIFHHEQAVRCVTCSPDSRWLASGGFDGTVTLRDVETGTVKWTQHCNTRIRRLVFSPKSDLLVSSADDGWIRAWAVESGELRSEFEAHSRYVRAIDISPDGRHLVTAGYVDHRQVKLWELASGILLATWQAGFGNIHALVYSPDGSVVAAAQSSGISLIDAASGQIRRRLRSHARGGGSSGTLVDCESLVYSLQGEALLALYEDWSLRLWNLRDDSVVDLLPGNHGLHYSSYLSPLEPSAKNAAFSPDGRTVAAGRLNGSVALIDVETGETSSILSGHDAPVVTLDFSSDNRLLVTGDAQGRVRVWRAPAEIASPPPPAVIIGRRPQPAYSPRQASVADLHQALGEPALNVRLAAAEALQSAGADAAPAAALLVACLSDESYALRRQAKETLVRIGEGAVAELIDGLNGSSDAVRSLILEALGRIGPDAAAAIPTVTTLALQEPSDRIRADLPIVLARISAADEAVVETLVHLLEDHDVKVQTNAAIALGQLKELAGPAIPLLIKRVQDENPVVARAAADALGKIGQQADTVVPALAESLRRDDPAFLQQALLALGRFGPRAAAARPAIRQATQADEQTIRSIATQILSMVDPQDQPPPAKYDATQAAVEDIASHWVGKKDWPQWGGSRFRNNTPDAHGIPAVWNVGVTDSRQPREPPGRAGEPPRKPPGSQDIRWAARLGSQTYGNPSVANGKVFIGTNNGAGYLPRYPAEVDLGVLLCFDEQTGSFLWQYSSPKLPTGRLHDWPMQGMPSTPVVNGDRLWAVTNRCEVICLDTEGFRDGENDGPFTDESSQDESEADVIWKLDMMGVLGASPHNMSHCSIITAQGKLFVCSSNGVDESHLNIPAPQAPSFLALDQSTGSVIWTDNSPGRNVLHGQWASPSYAVLGGQPQVIFPGGDGWLYSFDPEGDGFGNSRLLWKFDCNPKDSKWILGGRGTRNNIIGFPVVSDGLVYVAVGQDPEHGDGLGHLWCIDPARKLDGSDVSPELVVDAAGRPVPHRRVCAVEEGEQLILNPNSALVWHYRHLAPQDAAEAEFEEQMHRSISSPVIKDDILYIPDFSGLFHCLNAKTGEPYWTYDLFAACWGSALVVDGKVYVGDEDGDLAVFRHSPDPEVAMKASAEADAGSAFANGSRLNLEPISQIYMGSSVYSTPIVANGVLYIATKNMLYAIAQ